VAALLASTLQVDPKKERRTCKAQFPFKRNRLRCVNENRKKRKHLRWQAANHGCHCFDQAFLLAGACICCVKFSRNKRKRNIGASPSSESERIVKIFPRLTKLRYCIVHKL